MNILTVLFYQPILNLLVGIYGILPSHDLGFAIILVTVCVKIILLPLSWKQLQAQKQLQDIQPKLEELKKTHKDDKQGMMQAQMILFKEHNINPLSSCLPLIIQLPFLISLFYVFMNGLKSDFSNLLYPFIQNPGHLNDMFLGVVLLTQGHNVVLAVLAGITQFWQAKMLVTKRPPKVDGSKDEDFTVILNQQMTYMMPVITGIMTYQFPSGLGIYWVIQSLLTICQQYVFFSHHKKIVTTAVKV